MSIKRTGGNTSSLAMKLGRIGLSSGEGSKETKQVCKYLHRKGWLKDHNFEKEACCKVCKNFTLPTAVRSRCSYMELIVSSGGICRGFRRSL
jgi:hypothetical protein